MIKKEVAIAVIIIAVLAVMFSLAHSFNKERISLNNEIEKLDNKNHELYKEIYKLQDNVDSMQQVNILKDFKIKYFESRDSSISAYIKSIDKKLQSLKQDYETAIHFSDHYNSDSIISYFSNLPR